MRTEKATMSGEQVAEFLTERLRSERLLGYVTEKRVLEFPAEYLAEIVLNDGSKLDDASRLARDVESELREKGVTFDSIVRARWQVEAVNKVAGNELPGLPAGPAGLLFRSTLRSGGRTQDVWVDVTSSAYQALKPLGETDQALENSVRDFLRHRLSIGGAGYWDPIRDSRLELDARVAQYLRWRPYQHLKESVDRALRSVTDARRFLQCFDVTGKNARNFNAVLEELSGPGGAFAPAERLPTNNYELYGMLLESEKQELRQYYLQRLERACMDWPELKGDFPKVLAA